MNQHQDVETQESIGSMAGLVDRFRQLAVRQLNGGANLSQLSFALAFVATEIGLKVGKKKDSLEVFQTVLQAAALAAANAAPDSKDAFETEPASQGHLGAFFH